MSDVRPKALASYMEKRNQRFAAMSQTARRIKIDLNHTWRFRLLPVEMGPDKEPFVDIAQHWWAKQPTTCPRHTAEAWGGNPDYDCPICAIAERLRESSSEEINGIGYKARCNLRVRAWCIVFDQEDAKGDVEDMPMVEILNPYEFDMYKTTWESFAKFQKWALSGRRGGKEASDLGLLDLESGCDLLATQGAKGVTLDRCDPGPIFPLNDPKFDDYLAKIWSRIHKPQIVIPSDKDLLDVADKIEEYAQRGGGGGGGRRRGRDEDEGRGRGGRGGFERGGRGREEDTADRDTSRSRRSRFAEDQDADAPEPAVARSSSRRAPEPEVQPEHEAPAAPRRRAPEPEQQQEAPAAAPAPTRRRAPEPEPEVQQEQAQEEVQAPPARRAAAPQRRAPEPEPETQNEAEQEAPAPTAPPPARRGAAPTAPPPARKSQQTPADGDGDVAPQRPPTRRSAAPAPAGQQGVDEEEDNAPEEKRDPAPAVRGEALTDEAPPAVSTNAPAPKRSVGDTSDIKARLDKLNARGR